MVPREVRGLVAGLGAPLLAALAAGCDPTPLVDGLLGNPPAETVADVTPERSALPAGASGVTSTETPTPDTPAANRPRRARSPFERDADAAQKPAILPAAAGLLSELANLATLSPEEAEVRALFTEDKDASQLGNGKQILDRLAPDERNQTIVRLAGMGYLLHGPNSEVGRMVEAAGLLDARYEPMFADLRDEKVDSPASQRLADEAAAKISDPERLVTLVMHEWKALLPESRFELIDLTIDGDNAAGVVLMVTYLGTSPGPFAAKKIDGRWRRVQTSPAAEEKVKAYEANPVPATVKLPPREQIRITAADLSREFQANPSGAAEKYGGAFTGMGPFGPGPFGRGPFGPGLFGPGPFGPGAGGGPPQGLIIPAAPKIPKHELIVEGTVAFSEINIAGATVYLVTPAGLPRVNLTVESKDKLARVVAGAKTGQQMVAVVDMATLVSIDPGTPGMIALGSRQLAMHGEAAEPYGPLSAAEFLDVISDPELAAKNQARPIVLEGTAQFLARTSPFVWIEDNAGNRISCIVQASQMPRLRKLRPRQVIRLQGIYVPPTGDNQLLLHHCVLVDDGPADALAPPR